MTTLHGAAMRSHGGRLQRERDNAPRAALLRMRGKLAMAGVRMPLGAELAAGVEAGLDVLLEERRARGGR